LAELYLLEHVNSWFTDCRKAEIQKPCVNGILEFGQTASFHKEDAVITVVDVTQVVLLPGHESPRDGSHQDDIPTGSVHVT
jgi:hypothetical protein